MSIYFICDERRRRMKIGFTRGKDARQRLAILQIGNAVRLVVARFIADAGHSTERWFHRHYSDRHIGGEWFRYCETMLTLDPPSTLEVASLLARYRHRMPSVCSRPSGEYQAR